MLAPVRFYQGTESAARDQRAKAAFHLLVTGATMQLAFDAPSKLSRNVLGLATEHGMNRTKRLPPVCEGRKIRVVYDLSQESALRLCQLILARRYFALMSVFGVRPGADWFGWKIGDPDRRGELQWSREWTGGKNPAVYIAHDDIVHWIQLAQQLLLILLRAPGIAALVDFRDSTECRVTPEISAILPSVWGPPPCEPYVQKRKIPYSTITRVSVLTCDGDEVVFRFRTCGTKPDRRTTATRARLRYRGALAELCWALLWTDTPSITRAFNLNLEFVPTVSCQMIEEGVASKLKVTRSTWAVLVDHTLLALIQDHRTRGRVCFDP